MAGARTSWQGVGRPQCGQHKLLSFAGIIAVATVAVVAKWFLFFFLLVFAVHTIYGQILPFLWIKAASSEIWIILAWSIFKDGHNFISQPQLQSLSEAGNSIDSRFCRVVGWHDGLLYCNWKTAVPKWEEVVDGCAICPATWGKDIPSPLSDMGLGAASCLCRAGGCLQLSTSAT